MQNKKTLDINSLITEVKGIVAEHQILRDGINPFFGRLAICFENGRFTHIEKKETIK